MSLKIDEVSFSPVGRRRGPSKAWEDEGALALPLTFPTLACWAPSSPRWGEEK